MRRGEWGWVGWGGVGWGKKKELSIMGFAADEWPMYM